MNLQTRLIISYIVIIIVTLFLSFVILIATTRPFQNSVIRARLLVESQLTAQQLNAAYREAGTVEAVVAQFAALAEDGNIRLIFVDEGGRVVADSQQAWTGERFERLDAANAAQLSRLSQVNTFRSPDGETYLYTTAPIGPPDERLGYVAAVAPRASSLLRLVAELTGGVILAGLAALFVSLLLGVFTARSIALPLERIATATGAVASGDYEQRVQEKGPPEIKRVAASFNIMIDRVERSQQAMRDFVSNVSHELKTPLTSIQGFSQAILEGETKDETARQRAATIIHQEATRLTGLVEDLLDLARIDSGQVVMAKTSLDLSQILQAAVERLLPQAAKKQVKLTAEFNTLPVVVGDGDRLAQVFTNLLDNAVGHTPAGGQVKVAAKVVKGLLRARRVGTDSVPMNATTALSERGDFAEISISDTGPGIPAADLARIFERFYQIDKSRKRGKGTGLGLAIVSEIVEAHGGYIRAERVEASGTKFVVLLPVSEADVRTLISPRR